MTFDQLKYFYEAARFQHIGKAAKSVHISPSAVSAAIAALEIELGTQLFDRVSKSILLTDAGRLLQKEAEVLFDQLEGVKLRVSGIENELNGQYRLGASHFLASRVMSKVWSNLQEENPALIGEVCSLSTANVIADVVSGALDFGLCFSPFRHPDLYQEDIFQGQLQIAVRTHHPLAKTKLENRKACKVLSDYPAVIHKSHPGVDICEHHPVFDEFGITTKPSFLFDSDSCAIEKLIHSDAWAFIPDIVINHYRKKVTSLEVPKNWNAPYMVSVVMRKDRVKNVVLLKTKELIIKTFQKPIS
jgi:DNA-binding transcriptional LysR family regulator